MIFVNQPFCPPAHGKDLGLAYNEFMSRLRRDDWACFLDHDAMFTTRDWYGQLEKAVAFKPYAGFFTCMTNRCWCPWQKHWACPHDDDIGRHREFGDVLKVEMKGTITEIEKEKICESGHWFSGVMILVSVRAWQRVPFRSGLCGVDNLFHHETYEAGLKAYLLEGLYIYHWYRNRDGIAHLRDTHNPIACGFLGPGKCPNCGNEVDLVPRIS